MGFKPYRATLEHLVAAAWRETTSGHITYVCQCGETFTNVNSAEHFKEMLQQHREEK